MKRGIPGLYSTKKVKHGFTSSFFLKP